MYSYHNPIMVEEVVRLLACKDGGTYVDCTTGGGGHIRAVLEASAPGGQVIGIDRDKEALAEAEKALSNYSDRLRLVHSDFKRIDEILNDSGVEFVDGVLADLGVSSHQLDSAERGFSFLRNGPLDMRMDQHSGETASGLLERLSAEELKEVLKVYGEERFARKIAKTIKSAGEIKTTLELAWLVERAVPKKFHPQKIHVATKTFQALRIAVNEELNELEEFIFTVMKRLKKGGRIAVISFHSLEDRIVKQAFKKLSKGCICPPDLPYCCCGKKEVARVVTRKPVIPSDEECNVNPRARSAKLRVAEKV